MNRDPRFALGQELEAKQSLLDQLRALAPEKTRPRARQGDSMTAIAQRDTPQLGIFWVVQTPEAEPRLLAAGCPLDQAEPYGDCLTYGPSHYETCDPTLRAVSCGHMNTMTGRADASSLTGPAICSSCTPTASS